jgi:ribonuclease T2
MRGFEVIAAFPLQICPEPGKRLRTLVRVFSFSGSCGVYRVVPGQGEEKMRHLLTGLILLLFASAARAEGEPAGEFDYYVLSLGWSSTWCSLTGDARHDPQCDEGRGFSFTLHGLWPQFTEGWPSYCRTVARDPSRGETAAMADIMGGSGLAFYEWKKHGRCSGVSAPDYFVLSRKAFEAVVIPEVLKDLAKDVTLPASVVEDAFLEANPALSADMLTITCESGMIDEVRICLAPNLTP